MNRRIRGQLGLGILTALLFALALAPGSVGHPYTNEVAAPFGDPRSSSGAVLCTRLKVRNGKDSVLEVPAVYLRMWSMHGNALGHCDGTSPAPRDRKRLELFFTYLQYKPNWENLRICRSNFRDGEHLFKITNSKRKKASIQWGRDWRKPPCGSESYYNTRGAAVQHFQGHQSRAFKTSPDQWHYYGYPRVDPALLAG